VFFCTRLQFFCVHSLLPFLCSARRLLLLQGEVVYNFTDMSRPYERHYRKRCLNSVNTEIVQNEEWVVNDALDVYITRALSETLLYISILRLQLLGPLCPCTPWGHRGRVHTGGAPPLPSIPRYATERNTRMKGTTFNETYFTTCKTCQYKNSSRDKIANVNFLTTISHTRRPTSKYRKKDKPTSFNKLDDR